MMDKDERRALVIRLYEEGATLQSIGRAVKVTRERVRQLLDQYGVERRPRADRLYSAAFPARAEEVERLFLELRNDNAVSDKTGIDLTSVRRYVDENIPDPGVLRRKRKLRSELYSDEEMVACLHAAAKELETPMAHAGYAEWSRGRMLDEERLWPGPQGMMLRFGSWRKALARAGLPANPTAGPDPRFDLTDAVDTMVQAWRETETPPTVDGYNSWRAGREEFPASATARKFVDGWDALKLSAWPIVHGRKLPGVGSPDQSQEDGDLRVGDVATGGPYRQATENPEVLPTDPFERDPQELERSLGSHNTLQNSLSSLAREKGYQPLSPLPLDPEFDLAWRLPDGTFVLVEVKSATASNLEGQLRIGLGQILRYGQTLLTRGEKVRHILAVELQPTDKVWLELLTRLKVQLVTPDSLDEAFPG